MPLLDISAPVTTASPSWADSLPVQATWHHDFPAQESSNSSWTLNAHIGTHVDAPYHHLPDGARVGGLDLADMIGPCRVLDLTGAVGEITAADLAPHDVRAGERVLLRTTNSTRDLLSRPTFAEDYVGLGTDAAEALAAAGVRLVGIDYLGIEPYPHAHASTHHALLGRGVIVLEGLRLTEAAPGAYGLIFLPLNLIDAEAAPGRAVLTDLAESVEETR